MQFNQESAAKIVHPTVALSAVDMAKLLDVKDREIVHLRRQVAWFQRQIFGQKSERRLPEPEGVQGTLGELFEIVPDDLPLAKKSRIAAHEREHKNKNQIDSGDESTLFFDDSKVPVEVIAVPNPDAAGLDPADFEVIGEKVSHCLAQRPGSYVILKYVRPVIKLRATQALSCPPAPVGVIDGCRADVSFIAGMIIDKFAYHQPLYRRHVKLQDSGINVSRAWVTKLMPAAVSLIEPIFDAQLDSVRLSRVIAMDETPIKAGRAGPGKMKAAYFWPVVGEQDEICFLYYPSRAAKHIEDALGLTRPNGAVLQSDGYSAYAHYAKKTGITHAQCWAHSRRTIYDARDIEPAHADQALDAIAALYKVEQQIRNDGLTGQAKRERRQEQSEPVLDRFFAWIDEQFDKQGYLPSSPFLGALAYIRERRVGLSVFLDDPDVSIDTNHLERALRVIPMGKKNWLFSWTELGAKHIGIVQSLLATCRLHDINPYDYFVDVLQRVGKHPASLVHQLTPRIWKQMFAANPLRSDLHDLGGRRTDAGG
ncbi:IS66 family transposase [Massilia sp. RP-1-19]|uniref:IS66 family transposase n=1 Tax=Massilia polaris TaxID=2728846 RepID=A0A848HIA7_9BURK|nr:IS66 family transposase [Massilia polaris]